MASDGENIGFRIGEDSSVDTSNESGFDSSFERELEVERRFCKGNALMETIDIAGDYAEMFVDEDGKIVVRDI